MTDTAVVAMVLGSIKHLRDHGMRDAIRLACLEQGLDHRVGHPLPCGVMLDGEMTGTRGLRVAGGVSRGWLASDSGGTRRTWPSPGSGPTTLPGVDSTRACGAGSSCCWRGATRAGTEGDETLAAG